MVVNLSSKLKMMRNRQGLTQLELAKKIGVSESYICQIENGKMISIKKLDKLAKALGCEPKDLLQRGEYAKSSTRMVRNFRI